MELFGFLRQALKKWTLSKPPRSATFALLTIVPASLKPATKSQTSSVDALHVATEPSSKEARFIVVIEIMLFNLFHHNFLCSLSRCWGGGHGLVEGKGRMLNGFERFSVHTMSNVRCVQVNARPISI